MFSQEQVIKNTHKYKRKKQEEKALIPAFDYYMAPGVLKTFRKQLKQTVYDGLDMLGIIDFINFKNNI